MTRFDCDQFLSKLDDLIDGALPKDEAQEARAHLESCASCRVESDRALALQAATQELSRSIEPGRDLWPEIAGLIDARRVVRRSFERPAANAPRAWLKITAAAAVLVASVTIAYMMGLERARPEIAASSPLETGYTLAAYGDVSSDLEEAKNLLRAGLEQRRAEFSPETWSVVMDNLSVIDTAIVRIEAAMKENPGDGRLNRQLATAYRRQIDLLQRATRLPAEV